MSILAQPPATQQQLKLVRALMRQAELPTDRYTLMHRIPFVRAGLGEPPMDRDVDAHLRTLTLVQASALIVELRAHLGVDDED